MLLQRHEDTVVFLRERESTLVEESLDILKLCIIFVLVLDLLLKGTAKLLSTIIDLVREGARLSCSKDARTSHAHGHDSTSGAHAASATAH